MNNEDAYKLQCLEICRGYETNENDYISYYKTGYIGFREAVCLDIIPWKKKYTYHWAEITNNLIFFWGPILRLYSW